VDRFIASLIRAMPRQSQPNWFNQVISKAVPQHTIEAQGGTGCIAPTHSGPRYYIGASGQRHAPAALYPQGKTPGTHWIGGWMGPRPGLDKEVRRKILLSLPGSNIDHPVV
jgi:hypothetical protein